MTGHALPAYQGLLDRVGMDYSEIQQHGQFRPHLGPLHQERQERMPPKKGDCRKQRLRQGLLQPLPVLSVDLITGAIVLSSNSLVWPSNTHIYFEGANFGSNLEKELKQAVYR